MQDRYLFRGRAADGWHTGCLWQGDNQITINGIFVDPSTVGQCTGLLDGTCKPIFAGDILELYDYHGKRIVSVDYSEIMAAFYYGGDGFSDEYLFNSKDRTIIGTIHTTPELMEGNDD